MRGSLGVEAVLLARELEGVESHVDPSRNVQAQPVILRPSRQMPAPLPRMVDAQKVVDASTLNISSCTFVFGSFFNLNEALVMWYGGIRERDPKHFGIVPTKVTERCFTSSSPPVRPLESRTYAGSKL